MNDTTKKLFDLFEAKSSPSPSKFNTLLAEGPELQATNDRKQTLLHLAARSKLVVYARALLERGAAVDVRDSQGNLPLHEAARAGRAAIITELLNAGASINATNDQGETALHLAVSSQFPELEATKTLIERGANRAASDSNGRSALQLAKFGPIIKFLGGTDEAALAPLLRIASEEGATWGGDYDTRYSEGEDMTREQWLDHAWEESVESFQKHAKDSGLFWKNIENTIRTAFEEGFNENYIDKLGAIPPPDKLY